MGSRAMQFLMQQFFELLLSTGTQSLRAVFLSLVRMKQKMENPLWIWNWGFEQEIKSSVVLLH